jgi:DNA-binding MurR/RpiR family transcriptional regulator
MSSNPPTPVPVNLEQRILNAQGALSAADRKLAQMLMARGQELAAYSATEMAALAGVSKASAARFFRRLGFARFTDFRQCLREQSAAGSPLGGLREPAKKPNANGLFAHIEDEVARLKHMQAMLSPAALQTALTALTKANRVAVAGYRNGHVVASYAATLLSQVRSGVFAVNDAAGREAELMADLEPGDVLLLIDMRRRVARLAPLAHAARAQGAQLVLITDEHLSPLADGAAAVLPCSGHARHVFDSYVPAMSLVNHLATALATARPADRRRVRARLARIEGLHAHLTDLDNAPAQASAPTLLDHLH